MDERTYIRVHDGMPDHPKVIGLSDAAFRLYVSAMCWCSRYLTDGIVPEHAMRTMRGWSAETVAELAEATLIHPADDASQVRSHTRSSDGSHNGAVRWFIHDYTEHQRTAAEVAEFRRAKQNAGVTGNHERWHKTRKLPDLDCSLCLAEGLIPDASHMRSDMPSHMRSQTASGSDRKRIANASQETETEKDLRKELAQVGTDDDPEFVTFWAAYPRKVGKGQARKAWRSAVIARRVDRKEIITAAERFAAHCRQRGTEAQYIPHPATWLNGERYHDEADAQAPGRLDYPTSPWEN